MTESEQDFLIQDYLLEMILFEFQRMFDRQPYLEILYKTMVIVGYFGKLRVSEITTGLHPVRAKDVHIAKNKQKILFILYTSKTHGYNAKPQKVKITLESMNERERARMNKHFFCPFQLAGTYLEIRGNYKKDDDPFFIFSDGTPVSPDCLRKTLRKALSRLNLDASLYNVQSLRIGRTTDMVTVFHYSLPFVKSAGRWSSNTVYKYVRSFEF